MAVSQSEDLGATLRRAGMKALGGGVAGAAAMAVQVLTLMPLRTTMNYQYKNGLTTLQAFQKLRGDGGFTRFYRGLGPALVQAPLSRFGDTASNAFALAVLAPYTNVPIPVKTIGASLLAATFRIALVPVDTLKTMMQVEGAAGVAALRSKIRAHGTAALFHGSLASAGATALGHYPWFATFNYLQATIATPDTLLLKLARNAGIGFVSTVLSDTVSNSVRVVKTYRQTSVTPVSYPDAIRRIIAQDGVVGLFTRGLNTRILANGLQGLLFSVLWKLFEDAWSARTPR